jgi:exodeoxyribonuclease V gamma subunit
MPFEPALHLYRSNRTERLARALGTLLDETPGHPLVPECVVVQGRGMALWLMLELSRRHGISANTDFPFPRRFVERAFSAVLGAEAIAPEVTAPELLRWLVLSELPSHLERPEFEKLRRYVSDDTDGDRTFQLAQQIARVFDQYVTYRPDLVLAWEREEDGELKNLGQAWQPILWRALVGRLTGTHLARLERSFQRTLIETEPGSVLQGLPPRIAVFGISSLPPLYVRVFGALARHVPVHLYVSSPSPHFWADLATRREVERALMQGKSPADLHLDVGNPLLASLGRLGADFQRVLTRELEALQVPLEEHDLYEPPGGSSLLRRLHVDLYDVTTKAQPAGAQPLAADDRSITVHACHSAMREVEVLHDQLLDAFQRMPELRPHDVLVMTPDIDGYAPLIDAVFRRDPSDPSHIPYRIADRSIKSDSPVIEAFQRVLALVGSRSSASEVLDLLTLDAVRRRFDIAPDEIEQLTQWVVESGTRWAIDADDRAEHGQPAFNENTWRFGLTRLLVGYALPSEGHRLYEGVLPYDEIEGQNAALVGQLAEFCERLFEALRDLKAPRSLARWRDDLAAVCERMLHQDVHTSSQHQRIRSALGDLVTAAEAASFDAEVSLTVVRRLLDEALDDSHQARGFLAHGVTFCAMVPMRSIPFRVVGLLGMSDGQFPRESRGVDFDLMSKRAPKPGDRLRRDDDRYLFLEALLSARERLIVTYVGQSVRDNSRKPPSVVLSELLDHLVDRFLPPESKAGIDEDRRLEALHRPLFVRHPLQAFSPRYFDGSDERLFSHAVAYCEGARSLRSRKSHAELLFARPLPALEPAAGIRVIQLHELVRFFSNPIAYLINRRLQVYLREPDIDVPDREPWELDKLEEWDVATTMLELELSGRGKSGYAIARAAGDLPPGEPGRFAHEKLFEKVAPIASAVREHRGPARAPNLSLDLTLPGGARLSGELGDRWTGGMVFAQYSRIRGKHVLGSWIRHLAGCLVVPENENRTTTLLGRPETGDGLETWRYRPPKDPLSTLRELIELFDLGQSAPLLLFPSSSLAYARSLAGQWNSDIAIQTARAIWEGKSPNWAERIPSERDDPHYQRTLGAAYALGDRPPCPVAGDLGFEDLATKVFGPLLAHAECSRQ